MRRGAIALLVGLLLATAVRADVFRPAYLEITELDTQTFAVLWRVPTLGGRRLAAGPRWPENVSERGRRQSRMMGSSWEDRYEISAAGGLVGRRVTIEGMLGGTTDVIVRIRRGDGTTQLESLSPGTPTFTVTASPGPGEVALSYLVLGVEHILGGIDHLLFVLALLLLVRNLRRLILTITAFTVAHSITLICATLGWIRVPGPPVEAIIALSIVFVASEVINEQRGSPSITARSPWIVAFAFGLLHGLGFAGALQEVGLPETSIPLALLMFNVGVELGQLLFVLAMIAVAALGRRFTAISAKSASLTISYAIGTVAAFWTFERVAAFFV